ncbi:MAG: hypothetical protein U5K00_12185 [Melioribacteraceae bacterium]|nr:hypothetical protein [Melioribacteraceae bacterium]
MTEIESVNYIFECMNRINLDYDGAYNYIEKNVTDVEKYIAYNISIDLINDTNFFFTVDDTAGRIHNNVTNLSRDIDHI